MRKKKKGTQNTPNPGTHIYRHKVGEEGRGREKKEKVESNLNYITQT